jgi:hypothetical protein
MGLRRVGEVTCFENESMKADEEHEKKGEKEEEEEKEEE